MYIPSSKSGCGKPMGFQRWVNAARLRGINSNKNLLEIDLPERVIFRCKSWTNSITATDLKIIMIMLHLGFVRQG